LTAKESEYGKFAANYMKNIYFIFYTACAPRLKTSAVGHT